MNDIVEMATREEKRPYCKFVRGAVEDHAASLKTGHYVAKDVDMVHITPAYTKDVIIREVGSWFEKLEGDFRNGRIPESWIPGYKKQYEMWKSGQEMPLDGTPIRGWGAISPALQETLCRMNILTVEDAAKMNDDALRRIGMGSVEVKNKAIATLKANESVGPVVMENAELRKKLDLAEANVQSLTEKVNRLAAMVEGQTPHETPSIAASDLMDDPAPAQLDMKGLVAAYTKKFGEKPHHRMKPETIKAKLEE